MCSPISPAWGIEVITPTAHCDGGQCEMPFGRDNDPVNDPELAIRAALDGIGVLYTVLGYAAPGIKAGRLVPLLGDWRTSSAAIFLYYPSRRQVPMPLQAFIEFLRDNLQTR